MQRIPPWVRTLIALPIGIVAINVFHYAAALVVPDVYGSSLEHDGHRLATLLLATGAGIAGSFAMGAIARQPLWLNMGIFLLAMLAIDVVTVIGLFAAQPAWFKGAILVSLVPQVWIGGLLAKATYRRPSAATG